MKNDGYKQYIDIIIIIIIINCNENTSQMISCAIQSNIPKFPQLKRFCFLKWFKRMIVINCKGNT